MRNLKVNGECTGTQWRQWLFVIGTITSASVASVVRAEPPRWANPEVFAINAEPPHAFSLVFPDVASARPEPDWSNPYAGSSRYKMLNGTWKFKWAENPTEAPSDFYRAAYDVSGWDDIPVPLPWQMAGYGQIYYYNSVIPFFADPRNFEQGKGTSAETMDLLNPRSSLHDTQREYGRQGFVPTVWNPVGSYLKEFTIPDGWNEKRIVLHFAGVKGPFTCWLNGKEVGYWQDSFTPAEFDITDHLQPGENRLAVQVVRWGDASYQENQDRIRLSGIFRDVYLFATPKAHIGNFFVRADVTKTLDRAHLTVDVDLRNTGREKVEGRSVEFELIDPSGKTVLHESVSFPAARSGLTVSQKLSMQIDRPRLWHPEEPRLYTALIQLKDGKRVTEVIRQDVGFRRFEWDELGNTYLNGKRYMMRGVNRSDTHPDTGYTVSYEDMLKDARLMRQLNMDNVRTSHNPNDSRWYAICNRLGLTVINEANLESHNVEFIYSDAKTEPLWTPQAVYRMRNMVERDKNHPSVIIWSLGNEQFHRRPNLPTVRKMYEATIAIDPTRGVFCERMFDDRTDRKQHEEYLDFIGPMYRGDNLYIKWHREGSDRRPFFMSEYAHAMGNSMHDLAKHWARWEEHDGMNGGMIWDWRDQSVRWPLPGLPGKHLTYGGDWGDPDSHHGVFCMNGVVLPDHGFTGKSYEVKAVYQKVDFRLAEGGKFMAINKYATQTLEDFDVQWTLLKDGERVAQGTVALPVAPLDQAEFDLPVNMASFDPAADYHLNFDVRQKEATPWAEKGFVVACSQLELQEGGGVAPLVETGTLTFTRNAEGIIVDCGETQYTFDFDRAVLRQIRHQGVDLLDPDDVVAGVELNMNLQPTDDLRQWPKPETSVAYETGLLELKRKPLKASVLKAADTSVTIETVADHLAPNGSGYRHSATWTVLPSGLVQVDNRVQKISLDANAFCVRVGVRLPVAKAFDDAIYAAQGPEANYVERRAWTRFGVYQHSAMDFFEPFVRPQENGNRSSLKWIGLRNSSRVGLLIVGESRDGNGSVMPWSVEQFQQATHTPYLGESTRWILRYDAVLKGLFRRPTPHFVFEGDYGFGFSIRPLDASVEPPAKARAPVHEARRSPYALSGMPVYPEDWRVVSADAAVQYSSTDAKWAVHPDTLLTTQEHPFAFHTRNEINPWLVIDLGRQEPIEAIEIQNRADKGLDRARDLRVWISEDGEDWNEVFRATSVMPGWLVKLQDTVRGRYVKIGLVADEPKVFHLKGVRIFAK